MRRVVADRERPAGRVDIALSNRLPVVHQPILQAVQPYAHEAPAGDVYRRVHDGRVIVQGVDEIGLFLIVDELEARHDGADHLRRQAEVVAVPAPAGPVLHGRVPEEVTDPVEVQLQGVQAGGLVDRVLPGDQAAVQAGALAPADLGAGEEGVRRVVEALPEDVGRVEGAPQDEVAVVEEHGDGAAGGGVGAGGPDDGPGGPVQDDQVPVAGDGELRRGGVDDGAVAVGAPERGQLGDPVEPYAKVGVRGLAVRLEEAERELAVVGDEPGGRAGEPVAGGHRVRGGGGARRRVQAEEEESEEKVMRGTHDGEPGNEQEGKSVVVEE
jgi:hypothetical protein